MMLKIQMTSPLMRLLIVLFGNDRRLIAKFPIGRLLRLDNIDVTQAKDILKLFSDLHLFVICQVSVVQ